MRAVARPTIDLDGEWRFIPDPERLYRGADLPPGEPIQVPGCWESQVSRPYRIITAWYVRDVHIPAEWQGDHVLLQFGAVMYRCWVWLNGKRVGEHEGGYTPFTLEVEDAVEWGAENELAVEVLNPLNALTEYPIFAVDRVLLAEEMEPDVPLSQAPHGKQTWYSSTSGILQSVRIERAPRIYLTALRAVPDVAGERVRLSWTLEGDASREHEIGVDGAGQSQIRVAVHGPGGADVGDVTVPVSSWQSSGEVDVPVPDPQLWDIGQPNLYAAEAQLLRGGVVVDGMATRFGMRHVEARDGRILLNGRPIYMLGALDQDFYPDTIATPPSREMLVEQARLAQEMGLNLLRVHIKVPDPAYLDVADEAGLLLWCELPNWTLFTHRAAGRGKATLEAMVHSMGNHPSIIIWTIINEDWGTELRYEARDRHWLREMYDWLKELDPTRLVVDNSACETPQTPNFHVRTDIADFHLYFAMPDNAIRWRNAIADYARRPAWLWSPHGDALSTGEEPLILSEFGTWGLPRLDQLLAHYGREPWWFGTGQGYYRPSGIRRRFRLLGLDRIWPTLDALAESTQWLQFDALQYQIERMRSHDEIQGYVITELTDAYWEANGLLDIVRNRKVYHDRLAALNAPNVIIGDLEQRDLWGGGEVTVPLTLASYDDAVPGSGRVTWALRCADGGETRGEVEVPAWPRKGTLSLGDVTMAIPDVARPVDASLVMDAWDGTGRNLAHNDVRLAVLPSAGQRTADPMRVDIHDPLFVWGWAERVSALGHDIHPRGDADLIVASEINEELLEMADAGASVLVNVRTRESVPSELDLARRVNVHLRRIPHTGWPGQRSPWEGDWIGSFNWILSDILPGLPERSPLDFAYREVLPDHVLLGYDPVKHRDEVPAGMFVGWVHTPAALVWRFPQGNGSVTLTTFRLAPERGPVATTLLEALMRYAVDGVRQPDTSGRSAKRALADARR